MKIQHFLFQAFQSIFNTQNNTNVLHQCTIHGTSLNSSMFHTWVIRMYYVYMEDFHVLHVGFAHMHIHAHACAYVCIYANLHAHACACMCMYVILTKFTLFTIKI